MPPAKPSRPRSSSSSPSRTKTLPRSAPAKPRSSGGGSPRKGKAKPKPKSKSKKLLVLLALLAGGAFIALGALSGVLDDYGQKTHAQQADAIVVLGAKVRADGSAGLGLQRRVLHAARLYKKGMADSIITTGGVGTYPPAEAEVAAKLLVQHGVPRSAIVLENKSTSTWENATYATQICRNKGWKKVLLVSDPFHLWRAERNFTKCGLQVASSPVALEQWRAQPLQRVYWTARESVLVARDWMMQRV